MENARVDAPAGERTRRPRENVETQTRFWPSLDTAEPSLLALA